MNVTIGCLQFREALSAGLDHEPLGMPASAVDSHLTGCPDCAAWYAAAVQVTRLARVAPAAPIPDLSATILAATGPIGRPRRYAVTMTRVALALVGLAQCVLAVPALALGSDALHPPMHVAHESGAWNLGLAVAFLTAAARPRFAAGLLPLLAAFVAGLAAVSLPDVAMGDVPAARLAAHLPAVAALVLVAALARAVRGPRVPPRRGRSAGGGSPPARWPSSWDGAAHGPAAVDGLASDGRAARGQVA